MTELIVLNMLFATTFTLAKAVLAYVQPIFFIGVRMTLAGSLLLVLQHFFSKWTQILRKDIFLFLAIVLFHIYIPFVFEFWSLQYISSSKTALLYSLTPFIMALLSYAIAGEAFTKRKWVGFMVGVAGLLPILLTQGGAEKGITHIFFLSSAEVVLLIGICSSAVGWLLVQKLVRKNYSAIQVNGIGMLGGGFLALATSFVTENNPFSIQVPQQSSALAGKLEYFLTDYFSVSHVHILLFGVYLLLLIFIANIVCYNLYGSMLRRYSATLLSLSGLMIPGFAALFGEIFLGEHIPWQFVLSTAIVCVGLVIFYQEDLRLKTLA